MFCSKCGAQIEDGVAFCTNCGTPVGNAANAAPAEAPVKDAAPVAEPAAPAQEPAKAPVQEPAAPKTEAVQATAQNLASNASATVSKIVADPNLKEIAAHPVKSFNKKVNELAGGQGAVELKFHDLFSGVFAHHTHEDAENLFICGTSKTTPPQDQICTDWPKPWLFARIFGVLFIVTMVLYVCISYFNNPNALPGFMILGSFLVPFTILVFLFEINIPRNISFYEVLKMFLLGGALSIFVSLIFFSISLHAGTSTIVGALLVGVIEEAGKALVVALFISRTKKSKYILNGLLIGAAVGAGFAAFESAGYAYRQILITQEGVAIIDSMINNLILRGCLAPGGHVAYAAIEGAAIMVAINHEGFRWSVLLNKTFLSLTAICIIIHGIWDMPFNFPFYIKYIILIAFLWIALIVLITRGVDEINQLNKNATDVAA